MPTLFRLLLSLILLCGAAGVEAATIRSLTVERDGPAYRVRFEAVVDLAPDRVFAVLTDYDRLQRLNPRIVEAQRMSSAGGGERVRTVLEGCVLFFCRRLERVEEIRASDRRLIVAGIVAEASDFRAGKSRWELAAVAGGTRIRFRSRMVPDFFVPPLVGPMAIESGLRENMRTLVRRLEKVGGPVSVP